MKHILNDISQEERKSILEQHSGGMKVMTENFKKLVNSKLGDSRPILEEETTEGFSDIDFGDPSIDDAAHSALKQQGHSMRGKDDENRPDEYYVMYNGEKYFPDQLKFADYNDLGDIPRVEDGKLVIANPVWSA